MHIAKITLSDPVVRVTTQSRRGRLRFLLPGVLAGHVSQHRLGHPVGSSDQDSVQHVRVASGDRAGRVAEQRADGGFGIAQIGGCSGWVGGGEACQEIA